MLIPWTEYSSESTFVKGFTGGIAPNCLEVEECATVPSEWVDREYTII